MLSFFARQLLRWHQDTPRALPWSAGPRSPYHIWISEVIMQQTRIEQGAPYYRRFIERFPDVFSLASAPEDAILHTWQGLGYYSRARNLHAAAKKIVADHKGILPDSYEALLALPGIGAYTAAAIASFAYGLKYPVVDGNVKRVIARFAGITTPIDYPGTHEEIRSIAISYMSDASPADFNQAIMNFGALVCKPSDAQCGICPLAKKCYSFLQDMVDVLPARDKKKPNKLRYFHFLVLHDKRKILLERREGKDIWKGLYTPPLIETSSARAPASRMKAWIKKHIGHAAFEHNGSSEPKRQLLSHQTLIGRFHHYRLQAPPALKQPSRIWVAQKQLDQLGKPKMVADLFPSGKGAN